MPGNGFLGQLYYSITGEDKLEEILLKDKKLAEELNKISGDIKIGRTTINRDYLKSIQEGINVREKLISTASSLEKIDFTGNIDQLLTRLKEVRSEMDVFKELQKETNDPFKKITIGGEFKKAEAEAESLMRQIIALEGAMSALNKRSSIIPVRSMSDERELKMMSDYYKDMAIQADNYAKAQSKAAAQAEKFAQSQSRVRSRQSAGEFKEYIQSLTQQSDVQKQMSVYYRELEKVSKVTNTAVGSIKMLEAELKKLKDTYRSLSETDRNSPLGQAMLKEINNADENLAKINAQMANNANLAKTMGTQYNGLRTQIGMVARELPNLGISLSTFIISLSNNLPYLADEIAKARKEFDLMNSSGQKATPVWKQMIGAVFNWQTALIVGITVLTAYSREIQAWAQKLISGEKNVNKLKESLTNFNEELIKEETNTHLLFDALKQANEGTEGRRKAINNINNEYGKYLPNLLTEKSSLNELDAAYRQITQSIKESLAARLQSNAINEVAGESIKKQAEALEKIRHITEIKVKGKDDNYFVSLVDDIIDLTETFRKEGYDIEKTYRGVFDKIRYLTNNADLGKNFADAVWQYINNYYGYQEELIKIKKKFNPFFNKEDADKDVVENKKYWEEIKRQAESALEAIDSRQRESLDKGITKGIPKNVIDNYTQASKALKQANEQLKVYKTKDVNYYKLEKDAINAYHTLEYAIREGERKIEQTRINLMEEGGEKQLAQLKLNFRKRMDEVSKQTNEYVKMVQDQELKAWKEKNPTKKESEFVPQTTDFNTLPKNLQDIIVKQAQLANKEYEKNTQDLIKNLLKKWGDYGDKRAALEAETADKIKQVNSFRNLIGDDAADRAIETLKRQLQEGINALESESLKLTPFYQQLFGDIANYGNAMLRSLIEQTRNILAEAQKAGKNSKGTYSVEVEGQQIELTEGVIARLQKRLGEMDRQMSTNNPFTKLKNAIRDYKYASSDAAKDQAFKEQLESISAIAGDLSQSLSGLQDTLNVVGVNSPELDAVFGGLEKTLGGVASIDINKPFTVITGGLQAIGGLFQTIFNPRQARLQKIIENSQQEVKRLQNAFEDLDRVVDKALGDEVYSVSKEQIGNLRQQQAELSKQIQAERDKKKTDNGFIDDASRQIEELNQQIIEIVDNIRESILGGTVQEIAGQLGDALFDAFGKGEDAAEAWGRKVDEIVQGVIRRMLIQKLIEKPVGQILEKYTSKWLDSQGNFMGYDEIMQSATNLGVELKDFGEGLSSIINKLPDNIKQYLQLEESNSSLSQSLKGITEDQAGIGISYLNAIRADQSVTRNNLQRLTDTAIPFFNDFAIHVANLKHLETIANNTGRNVELVGEIRDILEGARRSRDRGLHIL